MQNNKAVFYPKSFFSPNENSALRWLVALSALPLFGVVAAFGIAPDTEVERIPVHTVIEYLALPSASTQTSDRTSNSGARKEFSAATRSPTCLPAWMSTARTSRHFCTKRKARPSANVN